MQTLHDDINSSKFFLEFKLMLQCEKIEEIGVHALKIMELLQLGKMEKGSITSDGRYRSLNARWFGCKVKKSSDPNSSEGVCLNAQYSTLTYVIFKENKRVLCANFVSILTFRVLTDVGTNLHFVLTYSIQVHNNAQISCVDDVRTTWIIIYSRCT